MGDDEGDGEFWFWPPWCPWRARPVNDERNSGYCCPWPRWCPWPELDDAALDEAHAARAWAGDVEAGVWLQRRLYSLAITGGSASEPLRRYAEACDVAFARATNDRERLQALNLIANNPSHRPRSPDDDKLRVQAATGAALLILMRQGRTKERALAELGEQAGKDPRTLERYLNTLGDEAYATLETRDSAQLRALADRCYAVPLATILSRKRQ